ncbi:AbrB/MazE/SpoVT family DNA-binding domain-containing protein [uncultured Methylobacterium sp.]|jgi:AbrB family looped-hinge helix DNA binding protein|uniref:AbrB/MazE/SpoVT family DNA-binding domain-containing protein n=1 Tax=uncultured Methylobacterium sp. TaxID=157278 RepID=UPI00262B7C13|nr:AbrB/MazE/SpoVT family DNA-binding domain-containing protein [uncultured Methylobacterium sp.]
MRQFALTLTPEGHVTLPAEARDALGVAPGERLTLVVDDSGRAILEKSDALLSLRNIARRARARARPPALSDDPIGDYLLAEDERTKSGR